MMKAISLWQPWASLWLTPDKIHETRHWYTNNRGHIAVHAAKHRVQDADITWQLEEICVARFGAGWRSNLPYGALVGVVDLLDCYSTFEPKVRAAAENTPDFFCGDWGEGRYAWKRGTAFILDKPAPYIGRQAFFNVPKQLLDGTRATVAAVP